MSMPIKHSIWHKKAPHREIHTVLFSLGYPKADKINICLIMST